MPRLAAAALGILLLAGCNWLSLAKNALTYPTIQRGEAANMSL